MQPETCHGALALRQRCATAARPGEMARKDALGG